MKNLGTVKIGSIMAAVLVAGVFGTYFTIQGVDEAQLVSQSSSQILGHVVVKVFDEDGNIKAYRQSDNAIVENGFNVLANRLFNGSVGPFASGYLDIFGIGSFGGAPVWNHANITHTTCPNQSATFQTTGAADNGTGSATITVTGNATFGPSAACGGGGGTTYREAGIFDNNTSQEMFARNTYTDVVLQDTDSLQINWSFIFTDT